MQISSDCRHSFGSVKNQHCESHATETFLAFVEITGSYLIISISCNLQLQLEFAVLYDTIFYNTDKKLLKL